MSDMIELLRKRRSIRKFTPERVAPETVELLVEALLRAPSSRGINPWELMTVSSFQGSPDRKSMAPNS